MWSRSAWAALAALRSTPGHPHPPPRTAVVAAFGAARAMCLFPNEARMSVLQPGTHPSFTPASQQVHRHDSPPIPPSRRPKSSPTPYVTPMAASSSSATGSADAPGTSCDAPSRFLENLTEKAMEEDDSACLSEEPEFPKRTSPISVDGYELDHTYIHTHVAGANEAERAVERLRCSVGSTSECFTAPKQFLDPESPAAQMLKTAAVLVPLYKNSDASLSVVITVRSQKMRTHKGEPCLPGGKKDRNDRDMRATALRESEEEIGVPRTEVSVLTEFPHTTTKSGVMVYPIVGLLPARYKSAADVRANPNEVSAVFTSPLERFLKKEGHRYEDRMYGKIRARVHFFEVGDHVVWGLTASILIDVARIALGKEPEFKVKCDPWDRNPYVATTPHSY